MRLPSTSQAPLPRERAALFAALGRAEGLEHGYVHARAGARDLFLFLREGRVWCAGTHENGSLGALAISDFVAACDDLDEATLHRTDLALFLCAAVLFRKPPAAHVPAALIDGEQLLKSLRALGKDAVLALQRKNAWALAFCRSGEPVVLYAAPELGAAASGPLADRIMELVVASPQEVTIDLYDEIRLPPAGDAGQALDALAVPATEPAAPVSSATLVVMLGDRVVFRHRVDKAETIVGRGEDVDLALDNLSVSRRHAVVRTVRDAEGEALVVEDMGSENGITLDGTRAAGPVTLRPGGRVGVGKYTLSYATHVVAGAVGDGPSDPRRRAATADIKTVAMHGKGAILEHRGNKHRVQSVVFTIGSSPDAHLRIKGLFVAPVQALLQVDGDGYRLDVHGNGLRKVRVNGAVTKRAPLNDGDELVIAGEKMRFRLGA